MSKTKDFEQDNSGWIAARFRHGYARVAAMIPGFAPKRSNTPAEPSAEETARAARRFAQALRENSHLAIDWLWCAAQQTEDAKRRYCLERALAIDPSSELARSALAKLPPETANVEMMLFGRPVDRSA